MTTGPYPMQSVQAGCITVRSMEHMNVLPFGGLIACLLGVAIVAMVILRIRRKIRKRPPAQE